MNPKGIRKVPGSPDEWMSHAESDLKLARLAISARLKTRFFIASLLRMAISSCSQLTL